MDIHNTVEEIVVARVDEIFEAFNNEGNPGKLCMCDQCRLDVICYTLNRTTPHYISSSRGASRTQWKGLEYQQLFADISALVHEAIKRVNHNLRPYFSHSTDKDGKENASKNPVFNIPTVVGRIFNGINFDPLSGVTIELLYNGELVSMKDRNWQNPLEMVANTNGNYSFWPAPVETKASGENKIFEYSLKVTSKDFEPLNHFFNVAVTSEIETAGFFTLGRTFKLPDLYLFPPGGEEEEKSGLY